jgi:aldehyde dehydrogenase (NAD+)
MMSQTNWKLEPSLESAAQIQLQAQYELFIDGKWQKPLSKNYFNSVNPADESHLAKIAWGNAEDVDLAVLAARRAYDTVWSKLSGAERGKYLFRIARLMQEKAKELAILETLDGGKPIRESRDIDIPLACNHFFYYAGWADKLQEAFAGQQVSALGVAGQITPWNFPLLMLAWKVAPALACGNTVVLKPAETTSLTALKFAEICQEAGLPAGVVNIVTGYGDTGAALVAHPDVDKIAFTGSTAVGKQIQKACIGTSKKLTLELGGKSANIILEDAPIDQAVEGVINSIFFNQGHVCCAGSRLFIQESIAERVLEKLKFRLQSIYVGHPLDKNTDIGAINSKKQLETIERYISLGLAEGAEIYQPDCTLPSKGFYCKPTLFTDVAQSTRIAQEEVFGPVLTIQTFRTMEEVVQKANNSPYGLAAGVWTDKGARIFGLSQQLKAGVVWANTFNKFDPASPFGGYKESGFGREGGRHGLSAYLKFSN